MDYFKRTLSVLAWSSLAAILILAPCGTARAQDSSSAGVSQQPDKNGPNIAGCWQGNAFNDSQGNTSIQFFFQQTGKKLSKKHSTLDIEPAVSVHGPIIGKVSSAKFTFHGHMANGCNIKGHGTFQTPTSLEGGYSYVGKCYEMGFTSGEFSSVTRLGATCP